MKLDDVFEASQIHWRIGATNKDKTSAIALAYLDARDVMDRFDAVCNGNWQVRNDWCADGKISCSIGVKVGDEWIWRANGAGDTAVEGDKGAFSDAFKRAAVLWGVGRYLYSLPNSWHPMENRRFSKETLKDLTNRLAVWQDKIKGK